MKNIVLFGGSFDPIHNGHINMALEAQKALGGPDYCEVIFIPNRVSVWKEQSIEPIHKINMISLAIKSYRGFSLSTFELDSFEENYTHITVEHFNNIYKGEANLFLLIGQDQVETFHKWKNVDNIATDRVLTCTLNSVTGGVAHAEQLLGKLRNVQGGG